MLLKDVRPLCKRIVSSKWFEWTILVVILINAVFIGVETCEDNTTIKTLQHIILGVFTLELLVRFIAAGSVRAFFRSKWNILDLTLVLLGYIPESLASNTSSLLALRTLRAFRVLRLLRVANELKLMVAVLIRSMKTMFYNLILFLIFSYLYAVLGVALFRLPDPQRLQPDDKAKYEELIKVVPHAPEIVVDPFGSITEAMFTLFKELTGEDWTDLYYTNIKASELDLIKVHPTFITVYHISWICIAAFLLLNLVTGAILNNYQITIDEMKEIKKRKRKELKAERKE